MLEPLSISAFGYFERQRRESCQAENRIHAVNYLQKSPLPSAGARFFPTQTVCARTKNKDYCQINSSPCTSMAGGKIVGHWVPAKTCHIFFFSPGRGTRNPLWVRVWGQQREVTAAWASCLLPMRISQFLEGGKNPCRSATHFQILGLGMEN